MLGLSLWEGRLPGRKAIENEDKGSHCSYRPESNFGTSDTVRVFFFSVTHSLRNDDSRRTREDRTFVGEVGSTFVGLVTAGELT